MSFLRSWNEGLTIAQALQNEVLKTYFEKEQLFDIEDPGNFQRNLLVVPVQEWYVKVDVDVKTGKDKKVLKHKYDRFLPAWTSKSNTKRPKVPLDRCFWLN